MKNLLYYCVAISTLLALHACGISGAMKNTKSTKGSWKDGTTLYTSKDAKMHSNYYTYKASLKIDGNNLYFRSYPQDEKGRVEGQLSAEDKDLGFQFYAIMAGPKAWKSNWIMYNPESKNLVAFYSDATSPDAFDVKSRHIKYSFGTSRITKGISKAKARRQIGAVRDRLEAQRIEEKRIQDSIFEANTLKGKDISKIEITATDDGALGVGGSTGIGFEVTLKDGRVLKSKNIKGGLTDISEFEVSTDFGTYSNGAVSLPSSLSGFTKAKMAITAKSKFGGPTANESIGIYFPTAYSVIANGEYGGQGESGSKGEKGKPNGGHGGNGGTGGNGGSVSVQLKATNTPAGSTIIEAQIYVNGSLNTTQYLNPNAIISVNANGGGGGSGGSGGSGYANSNINCSSESFIAGGSGGNGGNGGSGGRGGSVSVTRGSGCLGIMVKASVEGGKSGSGNSGGGGGRDKKCIDSSTSTNGNSYPRGGDGKAGTNGQKGTTSGL
jgi:hypothetical protein